MTPASAAPATGPLRVAKENPRYFVDSSGKAVYLTGSHTWNNVQDMAPTYPPHPFDFAAYLDFLERHHHNFIRLWRWELVSWNTAANGEEKSRNHFASPHPWPRTGPGRAVDGKPKFDVEKFDDAYFQRLRSRVWAAHERGIYVSIMLFEGWGLRFVPEGWKAHPFHPANNINGLQGEFKPGMKGIELLTLASPKITVLQEAYVRKVIDTVNDIDNVLYEVANESDFSTTEWQYHLIRLIHNYEASKPKQHPVGMTSIGYGVDDLDRLLKSPADWISPNPDHDDYKTNPPAATGVKVILLDTDHLWGVGGNVAWAWKSFCRGLNPIFMDPYRREILNRGSEEEWEQVRQALGDTRRFADRMRLLQLTPSNELSTTGYCLANQGKEYLIYQPAAKAQFSVSLPAKNYRFEWFDPGKHVSVSGTLAASGDRHVFQPPFDGDAVLHLEAD